MPDTEKLHWNADFCLSKIKIYGSFINFVFGLRQLFPQHFIEWGIQKIKCKIKLLRYILFILPFLFFSCEEETDFGFPSKIELSGNGESIDIKGTNDLSPSIVQIELLNYNWFA